MDTRVYLGYLADLVIAAHLAYVGYVVVGQVVILLGMALRWAWIRVPWFRISHLVMIWIVAIEALLDITCPLTTWEKHLRAAANQPYSERSFVGRCMDRILFLNEARIVALEQTKTTPTQEPSTVPQEEETAPPKTSTAPKTEAAKEAEAEDTELTPWYVGFALFTTATFLLAPPRWRTRKPSTPDRAEPATKQVVQQATP